MDREPTALTSALGIFLGAIAKAAVLLGLVDWDADQLAGVSLVIDTGIIMLGALFIRSRVTPTASPSLPAGTEVKVTDASGATSTTTV